MNTTNYAEGLPTAADSGANWLGEVLAWLVASFVATVAMVLLAVFGIVVGIVSIKRVLCGQPQPYEVEEDASA